MADVKVSALAAGTEIVATDLFYYIDGSTSKKVPASVLKDYVLDSIYIKVNASGAEPSLFWGGGSDDLDGCVGSIGIGILSLDSALTANACTVVGHIAGPLITTGDNHTIYGAGAGALLTTHSGCVMVGYQAGAQCVTSNLLYIENSNSETPLIGGNFATDRVGINKAIGSLAYTLDVGGTIATTDGLYIDNNLLIDGSGYIRPISAADASAPNNSIYYSTTASKLVYKDSGGSVNNLY